MQAPNPHATEHAKARRMRVAVDPKAAADAGIHMDRLRTVSGPSHTRYLDDLEDEVAALATAVARQRDALLQKIDTLLDPAWRPFARAQISIVPPADSKTIVASSGALRASTLGGPAECDETRDAAGNQAGGAAVGHRMRSASVVGFDADPPSVKRTPAHAVHRSVNVSAPAPVARPAAGPGSPPFASGDATSRRSSASIRPRPATARA
ncbi:hypothetical protein EON62_05795 [archaeon]|nr:MAG: hypothetical protein EON62_05795 [archaeon]